MIRTKAKDTVADLIRAMNKSEYAPIRDRMQAVILRRRGKTLAVIGTALSRSQDWVKRWNDRFKAEGLTGLVDRAPPGAAPYLKVDDQRRFKERLTALAEDPNGLAVTRLSQVQALLKEEYGVAYSRSGAGALLARLGFKKLKPRPRHEKNVPEKMQRWVNEDLPLFCESLPVNTPRLKSKSGSKTKHVLDRKGG